MEKEQLDSGIEAIKAGNRNESIINQIINHNILQDNSTIGHPHLTWQEFLTRLGFYDPTTQAWHSFYYENFFLKCLWCDRWEWLIFFNSDSNSCRNCHPVYCEDCEEYALPAHNHIPTDGISVPAHSPNNPPNTHSPDGLIKGYYDKIVPAIHGKPVIGGDGSYVTPTYGIEFEVERAPGWPKSLHADILACFNNPEAMFPYAMLKRDGSLSNGGQAGFEIVTAPATFRWLMDESPWINFFRDFSHFLAFDPPTTGLHIHISSNSLTPFEIAKLLKFVNDRHNLPFLEWISGRKLSNNSYTLLRPDREVTILMRRKHNNHCPTLRKGNNGFTVCDVHPDPWGNPIILELVGSVKKNPKCTCTINEFPTDHHDAFNINTKLPTVELRIFKGKMDASFFLSCIEFTDALVTFVKNKNKREMTYEHFVDWLMYSMARAYRKLNKRMRLAISSGEADQWKPAEPKKASKHISLDNVGINLGSTIITPTQIHYWDTIDTTEI